MRIAANLKHHMGTLVHPTARAVAAEFEQHRTFIASRLALSLGALLLAPPCLVLGDAPLCWQAAALGWFALPFTASVIVSRTGRLAAGEVIGVLAWLGLALTVGVGSGSMAGLAFVLLVPLEAALSIAIGALTRLALLGAGAVTTLGLALWLSVHDAHIAGGGRFAMGLLVAAVAYGGGLAVVASNLRRRRQREAEQRDDRRRLFADLSEEVPIAFHRSGAVLEVGPGARRLLATTPRELLGQGLFDRIHVADRPSFLNVLADIAVAGCPQAGTFRLRTGRTVRSEGGDFDEPTFAWVELRAAAANPAGTVADREMELVGLLRNVTARKRGEHALEDAQAAAKRNEAGRDLFLANVSHELRTPLNAIIGFSEILASQALAPQSGAKQREYAAIIQQSGQHLLSVVNTILDAAKIEAGTFELTPEPFDLGELIKSCVDMVGLRAEQVGIEIVRDVPAGSEEIVADQRACRQIVLNLLSNAIKFTPKRGRVTVSARPSGTAMRVIVADTGIGIGARDLTRVGNPFFQVRDGYDRDRDGTGLGLSVVRGLVGLHGGTIALESAPGQGTKVTVRLPLDCRRTMPSVAAATKIETIPRYSSVVPFGGAVDASKVHKLA